MKKIVILSSFFLTVFLCSSSMFADVSLSSPQLIKLNKGKLFSKVFGEKGQFEASLDESRKSHLLDMGDEKIHFSNLKFKTKLKAKAQKPLWDINQLAFSGMAKSFDFYIGELKYNLDRVQSVGGNQVRVKMEIICYDIKMESTEPTAFSVFSDIQKTGKDIEINFKKVLFYSDFRNLKLAFGSCHGPKGSIAEIEKKLANILKNTSQLSEILRPFLKANVDSKIAAMKEKMKESSPLFHWKDLMITQSFNKIYFCSKESICVLGKISAHLKNSSFSSNNELAVNSAGLKYWESKKMGTSFAEQNIPETFFQWIFREGYSYNFMSYQTETNEHKDLKDLMKSRFKQSFVWKDLKSFPKKTNLYIFSKASMPPKMNSLENIDKGVSMPVSSQVISQLFAPKENAYQSYAFLNTSFNGHMSILIEEGKLKAVLQGESSDTKQSFDPSYQEKYAPNTEVSHKRINQSIESMFEKMILYQVLPKINLSKTIELEAKTIKMEESQQVQILFD